MAKPVIIEDAQGNVVGEFQVPNEIAETGDELSIRQHIFQSGQADFETAFGREREFSPLEPSMDPRFGFLRGSAIGAGRFLDRLKSNVRQLGAEITGNEAAAERERQKQQEIERLSRPIREDSPVGSFVGEALPGFAVPGGKVPQIAAGFAEGALQGETPLQRLGLGAAGAGLGLVGARIGDRVGGRVQNRIQSTLGDPDALARRELMNANVPLSLSQRMSRDSLAGGRASRPIARFFERARFALTGNQPMGPQQQARLTEIIGDALDVKGRRLTREVLGGAVEKNRRVFRNAVEEIADRTDDGIIRPDQDLFNNLAAAREAFEAVGSDSPQVERIFRSALDELDSGRIRPDKLLKIRSNLSEATTKADIELPAIVQAIDAVDDQIARLAPEVAEELTTARERFRLILALRRGTSLSPSGEVNVPTFTRNLERVFRDFDVGAELPGATRQVGEVTAALNQLTDPFRSSGTAENLRSTDPSALLKVLAPGLLSVSGGGAGALLGGGAGRSLLQTPLTEPSVFQELEQRRRQ